MSLPAVRDQFAAVRATLPGDLSSRIAEIAKAANAAIMSLPPRPTGFVRTVDGVQGAREEAVKPDGLIVYRYQRLDVVIAFALDTLRTLSPKLSGAYAEAHAVFVNGERANEPYVVGSGDDVMIANPLPYARKIEVGHMHMKVPGSDHVYQQAQQIVQREFQDVVKVQFDLRALPDASATLAGRFTAGRQPQSRRRLQKDTRAGASLTYPALIFTLR